MAKLRDMEELIEEIVDVNMKSYMREALTCYMTDAFRACIVLSFIAIFEDIYSKLDGLAKTNSTARDIYNQIKKQRDEQKVFETDLLTRLKSAQIITELDADFLDVLRNLRNKAAHPSGHKPTAEEARFVFSETIDRFLSKPVLSTTQVADQIIKKLAHTYLFPTPYIEDHANIVNLEVKNLHEDGYNYLISKLLTSYADSNEQIQTNARRYILSLTYTPLNEKVLEKIKELVIEEGCSDDNKRELVMSCISANHKTLTNLNPMTYSRLDAMLLETIRHTTQSDQPKRLIHPISILKSIIIAGSDIATNYFLENASLIIKTYKYNELLVGVAKKSEWARDILIQCIFSEAGSNQFEVANKFADNAYLHDNTLSNLFNEIECFTLIINIYKAAETGAFSAIRLRDSYFRQIPKIREKALSNIEKHREEYEEKLRDELPRVESLNDFLAALQ